MSPWQNRHWEAGSLRRFREPGRTDGPCHVEYTYPEGPIASVCVHMGDVHTVCVAWRDGRTAQWTDVVLDIGGAYQQQFGVSVSADGRFLFVQTWAQGLHCLDAATGKRVWHSKSRRSVTSLMVSKHTLTALQREHALLLMDVGTGAVLRERPVRAFDFYPLTATHFICRTTARQWEIIRAGDLETVQVIPHKFFPDDRGDTPWCIRDVWLEGGQLWCNAFRSAAPNSTDTIDDSFRIPLQAPLTL